MDLKSSKTHNVCFVLPTYNEVTNIKTSILSIFAQTKILNNHKVFVLVVDDNSPDGTQKVVKDLMKKHKNLKMITGEKRGLGEAYKRGFDFALSDLKADIVFQMDSDGQHDAKLIPNFLHYFDQGFELIIGSRFVVGGSTPEFSLRRKLLSRLGNLLVRYVSGVSSIKDCTSGYRCISASLLKKENIKLLSATGYAFQSSLLCELHSQGAKSIEIPINFTARLSGKSKLSLKDQVEFLLNITRLGFRNYQDFLRYSVVGFSGVIINMSMYFMLTRYFGLSPYLSPIISIECAVLSNFIFNHYWTFQDRNHKESLVVKMVKFHSIAGLSGLTNYLVFISLIKLLGVNDLISNLIGIALGAMLNYLINSNWTWRKV